MNTIDIMQRFSTEEACREYLVKLRWPNGVKCPRCGCDRISELKSRKQYTCLNRDCRYRFSATSDTVLHSTKLPLQKWFLAIYMLSDARKSISSHQIARQLDISIKRAWHLTHRIREAMREDRTQADLFHRICQADEYYHGGKPRPEHRGKLKRGRGSQRKQPVLGVYENGTPRIRTGMVNNVSGAMLSGKMHQTLDTQRTVLHTDELASYHLIGKACSDHRRCNHKVWFVAKDGTHVNGVENAWSLWSRTIMGSFHHISRKHMPRYLAEFDSRFNARPIQGTEYFEQIVSQGDGRRLTMKQLVGDDSANEDIRE